MHDHLTFCGVAHDGWQLTNWCEYLPTIDLDLRWSASTWSSTTPMGQP